MTLLTEINDQLPQFARQERKVARIVLQSPDAVLQMTITALANAAEVATATVTRFVRKLNCPDFATFKLRIAQAQGITVPPPDAGTAGDRVYSIYTQVLQGTWDKLDERQLHAVADQLGKARRVYVYGLGSSGYTAQEMAQRLIRMGIAAFAVTDSHMMIITAGLMTADDVVLILSHDGRTADVNEATSLARDAGAVTIGITASPQSVLAQTVAIPLIVQDATFVGPTHFVNSQLATVYVLDILTNILLARPTFARRMQASVDLIVERQTR